MTKKLKLLFVLRDLGFGGAERQVLELCRGLDREKFEITIALFFEEGGYYKEMLETGVDVRLLAQKHTYKLACFSLLKELMKQEQFDVVHTYLPIANFLGGLAARCVGARNVICSMRNANPFSFLDPFCLMDLIAFHLFADKVLANSKSVAHKVQEDYRVRRDKIRMIYNGKDIGRFEKSSGDSSGLRNEIGIPPQSKVVLSVGRVTKQKGHADLVRAADILINKEKRDDLCFLIVGKAEDEYENVKALIAKFGLMKYVVLVPPRRDIGPLFALSDVLVLPSLWEGLANVLLEAMAAKIPVVASDIPPNREVVVHEKNGWLVPVQEPAVLARGIKRLLDDPDLADRLVEAAASEVKERFSHKRCALEHEKYYQGLLDADHREGNQ